MMHMILSDDNGDDNGSVHDKLFRSKSQPQPAYYLFETQPIHKQLHENLNQENCKLWWSFDQ